MPRSLTVVVKPSIGKTNFELRNASVSATRADNPAPVTSVEEANKFLQNARSRGRFTLEIRDDGDANSAHAVHEFYLNTQGGWVKLSMFLDVRPGKWNGETVVEWNDIRCEVEQFVPTTAGYFAYLAWVDHAGVKAEHEAKYPNRHRKLEDPARR